jgi:hypothetical protein
MDNQQGRFDLVNSGNAPRKTNARARFGRAIPHGRAGRG